MEITPPKNIPTNDRARPDAQRGTSENLEYGGSYAPERLDEGPRINVKDSLACVFQDFLRDNCVAILRSLFSGAKGNLIFMRVFATACRRINAKAS
jgi:hypothetical protein